MTGRWIACTRLAWRLVRHAPARSALIAVLVALPVLAGTFVAVTIRTGELSPAEAAQRYLGTADAIAVVTPYPRLDPVLSVTGYAGGYASEPGLSLSTGAGGRDATTVDLAALLPPGTRAIPAGWERYLVVTAGKHRAFVSARLLDLADPLTRGMYDVRSGQAPRAGQVAVTTHLAARLGLRLGGTLTLGTGTESVSAFVRDPSSLSADQVIGPAASLRGLAGLAGVEPGADATWLIRSPGGAAPDLHDALAADGIIYETRSQWEHPPAELLQSVHVGSQGRAILGSVIGFGLAEIVLLAGTAFAVGIRRQVRELGLLRAVGGDERDVSRVVLAQGLLLGVTGALGGVALGFAGVIAGRGQLENIANRAFGPLDARPAEIAGVALVGVVAALLAAVVPARTSASLSVLDMLRTRFRVDGGAVQIPRWAIGALVAGPALVIGAAIGWHHATGGLDVAPDTSIGGVVAAVARDGQHDGRWTGLVSLGAAITLAGIARACPALVSWLGRRAGRLPLSLRLAIRDAARHRHRTAPAVAAVATVVAGAVLVLLVLSSTDIKRRGEYTPLHPVGTVSVSSNGGIDSSLPQLAATTADAARRLGGGANAAVGRAVLPAARANDRVGVQPPGCGGRRRTCDVGPVGVAATGLVHVLTGRDVSGVAAQLSAGGAIVFEPGLARHGTVVVDEIRFRHGEPTTTRVDLPALVVAVPDHGNIPPVVIAAPTAGAHGWHVVGQEGLIRPTHLPTQASVDRVAATLGNGIGMYVERGYHSGMGVVLLALLGSAALAVLLGTSIAVALAMVESRPDMATFAAVGASPARRRILAMGQAAAVGTLGTALGLLLGLLVGIALLEGSALYPLTLPFRWLALLVVAAPTLAVTVAGALTRSQVPMTRRIA